MTLGTRIKGTHTNVLKTDLHIKMRITHIFLDQDVFIWHNKKGMKHGYEHAVIGQGKFCLNIAPTNDSYFIFDWAICI